MTDPNDLIARIDNILAEDTSETAASEPVGFDEPPAKGWLARAIDRILQ